MLCILNMINILKLKNGENYYIELQEMLYVIFLSISLLIYVIQLHTRLAVPHQSKI